jgi:threonine/homoserine/homoserine lactone efflux protein
MDILGFAFAVLLIELTPGPNMAWLVTLTLAEGRRSGLAAIGGIALGLSANAIISALAASFILQQSEAIAQGISILGASMMGYLAWQAWRDAGDTSQAATPKVSDHRNFVAGFVINLLNPKATLFFVTVMPQFVAAGLPSYSQALTLAAISVVIATGIHLALVFGAEQLRPALIGGNRTRLVSRVLALAMLGVGLWFLAKAFL